MVGTKVQIPKEENTFLVLYTNNEYLNKIIKRLETKYTDRRYVMNPKLIKNIISFQISKNVLFSNKLFQFKKVLPRGGVCVNVLVGFR